MSASDMENEGGDEGGLGEEGGIGDMGGDILGGDVGGDVGDMGGDVGDMVGGDDEDEV